MTRVWVRTILLVCLALTMGPASAVGATGRLSLATPPWLLESSGTPPTSGSLPHTGSELSRVVLTGCVLLVAGAALRLRVARPRG